MDTTESILTSVKKLLGIDESYTHFDADLIMHLTLEKGRGYVSAANNKNPNHAHQLRLFHSWTDGSWPKERLCHFRG